MLDQASASASVLLFTVSGSSGGEHIGGYFLQNESVCNNSQQRRRRILGGEKFVHNDKIYIRRRAFEVYAAARRYSMAVSSAWMSGINFHTVYKLNQERPSKYLHPRNGSEWVPRRHCHIIIIIIIIDMSFCQFHRVSCLGKRGCSYGPDIWCVSHRRRLRQRFPKSMYLGRVLPFHQNTLCRVAILL